MLATIAVTRRTPPDRAAPRCCRAPAPSNGAIPKLRDPALRHPPLERIEVGRAVITHAGRDRYLQSEDNSALTFDDIYRRWFFDVCRWARAAGGPNADVHQPVVDTEGYINVWRNRYSVSWQRTW